MTFKTVLPLGIVAMLAVVAVGAAVLGVSQEPRLLFFTIPSPTSGSSAAREQLAAAATKTLGERNFKIALQSGPTYRYQTPDIFAVDFGPLFPKAHGRTGLTEVQVGTRLYFPLPSNGRLNGRHWLSQPVRDGGLSRVLTYLSSLTGAQDVKQSGRQFSAIIVTFDYPIAPAGVPVSAVALVSHGRVVRERISISQGIECSLLGPWCSKTGHLASDSTTIRYATFGSAAVRVPPSREVIQAEPCGGSFVPPGHCV